MTLLDQMLLIITRVNAGNVPSTLDSYLVDNLRDAKSGTRFVWFPTKAYYPDGSLRRVWWRHVWFFKFRVFIKTLNRVSGWLTNDFVYPVITELPKQKE